MCLDSGNAATQLSAPESSTQRKPLTGRGMTQINDQCHEDEAVLDQEEEECYLYECWCLSMAQSCNKVLMAFVLDLM